MPEDGMEAMIFGREGDVYSLFLGLLIIECLIAHS